MEKNKKSLYTSSKQEDQRLLLQNQLLDSFDGWVYKEVFESMDSPFTILDIGCGTAEFLLPKLQDQSVKQYIGLDKDDNQIQKAKSKPLPSLYTFQCFDIEASDFEEKLKKTMEKHHIQDFDLIHISMVLLHLEDCEKLLSHLHSVLSPKGKILIRDIDDGLNFASPDDGTFKRLFKMGLRDEVAGNRYTGRKIYSYLEHTGYKNIELKCQGLSTCSLDEKAKDIYFRMSFQLIIEHAYNMHQRYPDDQEILKDYKWSKENRDRIYQSFMKKDFIASLGFMTFIASA